MSQQRDIDTELKALELQYWNAIRDRDPATATSLSDEPCVVVGAQGVAELDREKLGGMLANANYELADFRFESFHVRPIAEDVVVVAYKVKEDLSVDGEDVALEAFDSSVWVRRGAKWVCALHTESPAGDPFGRH